MFDLSRLTDVVGGLVGQQVASGGISELGQQLSELGVDVSQFDGVATEELLALISEQGLDPSQLDAQSLLELAQQSGIELPLAEVLETFNGRPGE